jgi:UDP:flavonoid glycosyltransferase YjiC (YdhE family)
MNSVHESLLAGVPMIVVPLQEEEEAIVARRVRETGTGVGVGLEPPYGAVRAPDIRRALETVLADERYAQRAAEIGDGLRAAGGEERAAQIVLERCGHSEGRPSGWR